MMLKVIQAQKVFDKSILIELNLLALLLFHDAMHVDLQNFDFLNRKTKKN